MSGGSREASYLAAGVRELDRLAIEEHHIPGFVLMQRAGQAAFDALLAQWPQTRGILCFCGNGNNGGDGYVIAALASEKGLDCRVYTLGNPVDLKGDARKAFDLANEKQVPILPFCNEDGSLNIPADLPAGTVIVDALLGTGLAGDVRGAYVTTIDWINQSGCPVLAVDIPSGLCSDTGVILGSAVRADVTVTFIGRKLGQFIAEGPALCGKLVFDDLQVPAAIYGKVNPAPA